MAEPPRSKVELVERLVVRLRRYARLRELDAPTEVVEREAAMARQAFAAVVQLGGTPIAYPDELRDVAHELQLDAIEADAAIARGIGVARETQARLDELRLLLAVVPIRNLELAAGGHHAVVDGAVTSTELRDRVETIARDAGWTLTNRLHVPGADSLLFRLPSFDLIGSADGTLSLRRRADQAVLFAFAVDQLRNATVDGAELVVTGSFPAGTLRIGGDALELENLAFELRARFRLPEATSR